METAAVRRDDVDISLRGRGRDETGGFYLYIALPDKEVPDRLDQARAEPKIVFAFCRMRGLMGVRIIP